MNNRIREIRKDAGLNQDDFATRLGLTKNFISLVETGGRIPSDRTLKDICREFNINETWLKEGIGSKNVDISKEEYIAEFVGRILKDKEDSFKKRYITMLSKLDENGWEALEKIALAMEQLKKD